MVATDPTRRLYTAQRQQLDADARATIERMARAYQRFLDSVSRELEALQAVASGEGMTTSELRRSAVLERLQERLRTGLAPLQKLIASESQRLQDGAIADGRALAIDTLADVLNGRFNRVPLAQITALIDYVGNPAFQVKVQGLGDYHAQHLIDILIADEAQGRNPTQTARHIVQYLRGVGGAAMPLADAVRMARTIQLYSARRGTQAIYQANRDVVQGWYWISALDYRTCPACWAMHGTLHPVDELLNDHYRGRCAMSPKTALTTAPRLGTELFEDLPASQQRDILGPSAWSAWRDGQFELSDVVGEYRDDLYGIMRHARPLQEIIGVEAARAYRRAA